MKVPLIDPLEINSNHMKSIFRSKTFWLAALQAAVGAVVVFQTSYPTLGYLAMAKSFLDVILRVLSNQQVILGFGRRD